MTQSDDDDREEETDVATLGATTSSTGGASRQAEATFEPDIHSPQAARAFLDEQLDRWGMTRVAEVTEVLVSELVTNAVVHARTDATVRVSTRADRVRVEVTDRSSEPAEMQEFSAQAMSGRGLRIVDALADAWGVDHRADGKTVWFELAG